VDITTKYVPASLVTVSRMLDEFIPWRLGMNCVCTRTDTRTTMSEGTDRRFDLRSGEIRKSGRVLTKEEREGILSERKGVLDGSRDEAYVIRIQRDGGRYFSCWKYDLSYGTQVRVCDEVEILTWFRHNANEQVSSNTELYGSNRI